MSRLPRTVVHGIALPLALCLPLVIGCKTNQDPGQAEGDANSSATLETAPEVGTITKIRGSRGVSSPDLPEGAFLGEGAAVHAGQWLELPRGTRVEIELTTGTRLRLDEDSRIKLPTDVSAEQTAQVELTRGRLIVLADAAPLEVIAADDRLLVERGEVELHNAGETRHFGVVQGRAILWSAERKIPLGPGASISTPAGPATLPEKPVDDTLLAALVPTLSLAPLHESEWASAFEESARLAEDVPQGVGSLVARRAGSKVERQSLRLTEQTVNVTISGRIARTQIEQAFHNDSGQTLEGIYQFPLPADASISDLQLLVGDTWMRGEMLEKTRARQIFRQIVDATVPRDPALLQWEQGGIFKLNIFPIPGKGERRIKIAYTQVLPAVGDSLRYRYPMGGSGATDTEIGDFEFNVTVDDAGLDAEALAGVSTPMAELARTQDEGELRLTMSERDYQPSHELGVDVPLAKDERRVMAATHRDRDGQGYFMLTLKPDLELAAERKPVHYAFVLDRSHGTSAELWTAAEGMTKAMIGTLEPDDQFTILACDTACDRLDGGLRSTKDSQTLAEVERFLDAQVLAGASDIGNMLERAGDALGTNFPGADSDEVEHVVVYMGDGVPTSGALTPDELGTIAHEQLTRLRIQAVALGARSDLLVLDNLVRQSGGDLMRADARDDLDKIARELRLRAQVPVARDLELELPPALTEVYPKAIPALRPGDTLTLVGKLAEGDAAMMRGDVRLHGQGSAGVVDERFQIMLDAEYSKSGAMGVHAHLPRTWAQHEITHLTQTQGAAASEQIIALSREYNVLSRFTALLVLENDRMYREFNVARKAGDKDNWNGEPTAGEDEAKPSSSSAPTDSVSPVEEAEGLEKDEKAKSDDRSTATETVPAFEPEPEPSARPDPAPAPGGSSSNFEDSFDEDPFSPQEQREQERDSDFDGDGFDFEKADASEAVGGATKSGGGRFTPPPPKKQAKPSQPRGDVFDPFEGGGRSSGGWGGGGGGGGGWDQWQPPPRPKMLLREVGGPSGNDLQRIAELQRVREADPSSRKAHRELVRRAIRDGHPDTLAFTAAWAAADPDHAPALLAHADQLAAAGDPLALRTYASAVEVEAFSTRLHQRMADALTLAGDFERACSHRRALVSIDPSDGGFAADHVDCLASMGRTIEARTALELARTSVSSNAGKKELAKAEKALDQGTVSSASRLLHSNADLRAELRWTSDENLDVAFVDRRGRRLSVLRPQGVRVREERDGAERVEIMTMRDVNGTVFIEVTRPETRREDPVRARLTVKTATGKQTWNLSLQPGSQRVALARWD